MGEVYRAKDSRLKREVAIKVLPPHVTSDSTKRQRFEREAQAIAALNHPHICALFDVGSQDGAEFLVMEYLEGETLERRLVRGALPLAQAVRHAIEIADALDHAHRHGIVHRDLKPSNIILTNGGAKLLDFGLAKWHEREPVLWGPGTDELHETWSLTAEGSILGTLQYMAPEQVEGKDADARADLFALGAIVYEMVTGRKAFTGGSHASLIAAILTADPVSMAALEPLATPDLERIVRKCLAKDPDARWQTARDLLDELKWVTASASQGVVSSNNRHHGPSRRARLAFGAFVVLTSLVVLAIAMTRWRSAREVSRPFQFVVEPPEGSTFNPAPAFMAVSPDGRHLAFSAANRKAGMALWLRSLDSVEVRQLTSEEGAQPFWSPDSRFIAFYGGGEYKKVDITTGRMERLINAQGQSGTWNQDGVIVMKLSDRPVLSRFSVAGGPTTPATTLDATRGETAHNWPQFLPDGRRFLYVAGSTRPEYEKTIYVGSLDSATDRTVLFTADSNAVYSPQGYLLFLRGNTLVAQPFDAQSLRFTGEPVPIADGVDRGPGARGAFSISRTVSSNGVLAYRGIGDTRLQWLDRDGRVLETIGPPGHYANPALSPDGRRAAVARLDRATGSLDIWLIEIARGVLSRFTFDPSSEDMPLWSPDGSRIIFRAAGRGSPGFFDKASSGTGPQERVLNVSLFGNPLGWSRQGRALVYGDQAARTLNNLWEVPRFGDPAPVALVQSEFQEIQGQPSPDGRWLAYVSNESGRYEVYVRSLTGEGKWPVSTTSGLEPKWRRDGKEIFYLAADRSLMSVAVRSTASTFEVSTPTRLFETRMSTLPNTSYARNQYDVTPDGQRFLINQPSGDASASSITVVVNWQAALSARENR
jgi:serine/threonine protein kinase